ncbi:MAG: metallophosphoesterase, partial [Verrucomicrobia bacterium]|nr:metallophosphoesterase [Verrucomicrobiota bacterium]
MPRDLTNPIPQPIFKEPVFNETLVTADPAGFQQPHPSDDEVYKQIQDLLAKDVVGFDRSRIAPEEIFKLETALGSRGPDVVSQIERAAGIVFHALGDSGASNSRKYATEMQVADQVTIDAHTADPADRPAFLFHLGDVVYDFGESMFYYDQFYDPFRNYPAPIFAIPGNHDSFIVPGTPVGSEPLTIFRRNFCSEKPAITPEAGSLHRTAMTQPGVYFTLDAPFMRVIALFSNSLEDPGVISSEGGKWPAVPDFQLEYLAAQLKRIKDEQYRGAVLLATHHPAFTYSPSDVSGARGNHGCSSAMLRQIDKICLESGVYPHAFLSGHAHNYQRYTRELKFDEKEMDVPFVVCGNGGHAANPLVRSRRGQPSLEPMNGSRVDYLEVNPAVETSGLILEKYDDRNYGYL